MHVTQATAQLSGALPGSPVGHLAALAGGRRHGAALRTELRHRLVEAAPGICLRVSAAGVAHILSGVAWEIGPALVRELSSGGHLQDRWIVYVDLTPETCHALHVSFSVAGVVAPGQLMDGTPLVLGRLPGALQDIMALMQGAPGGLRAADLTRMGVRNASRNLHALHEYPWLYRQAREATAPGERTWTYRYFPAGQ